MCLRTDVSLLVCAAPLYVRSSAFHCASVPLLLPLNTAEKKGGRRGDLIGRSLPIGRAQRKTTFLFVRLRRVFYACFRSCVCFSFLLGARTRVCAVCYPCCSSGSVIRQLLLRFIDLKVFLGGFILFCASSAPWRWENSFSLDFGFVFLRVFFGS